MYDTVRRAAVAAALLVLALAGALPGAYASSADVHYDITIPPGDHRSAFVSASLVPEDAVFYMFPGANQFPRRWASFVSDFEVVDEDGSPLPVAAGDDGTWRLSSLPQGRVTLRYRVDLEHEEHAWSGGVDGAAYWREWGAFYTARALFVVNGQDRENITVAFTLPDQWQVTTPWQNIAGDSRRFLVPDHQTLGTSMFFAGIHKAVAVRNGPFEIRLALGGDDVLAQEDVFVDLAGGVLDYYVDLMGGVPRLPSGDAAGPPVVIINQAATTDGEAVGNNISILLESTGNPMAQHIARLIFAHEFFHLWNGKSFVPDGEDAEWFKEGFSNYYTLKALHHVGYLTDESCLDLLAGFFYPRYMTDDAVGRLPLTRGDLKHDHWGLIYSGGLLVAIAQDLQMRAATGNDKSLDDLMRYLFGEYRDNAYSVDDIERLLGELNGVSQAEFFDRYIHGTDRIDISRFLALAGIETVEDDGRTYFRVHPEADPGTEKLRRGLFGDE